MSDDTISMADLAPLMKRMQMARMLQGGNATQMMPSLSPMPVNGQGGADQTTPYAGVANAGANINQMLGQKLLGNQFDNAMFSASPQGIPMSANVTKSPAGFGQGMFGRLGNLFSMGGG